ncbi:MAG: hypothetical protein CMP11_05525 [Zetaproteobacteria bacterium]|nr:hypothetical protein [Pseudobdellovibrionaceae bacterium]|tara:strand:+ start:94 stop:408 length:315 start_codon:yes stop_codon:yes gene_type:complete
MENEKIQLEQLRKELAKVDSCILKSISQRMDIAENIGKLKKELNEPIDNSRQEHQVLKRNKLIGKNLGLNEKLIDEVYLNLIEYSKYLQKRLQKKNDKISSIKI